MTTLLSAAEPTSNLVPQAADTPALRGRRVARGQIDRSAPVGRMIVGYPDWNACPHYEVELPGGVRGEENPVTTRLRRGRSATAGHAGRVRWV